MAYKVHTVCKKLPRKYPKLFSKTVCHKGGTATVELSEPADLPLLMAVNRYLEEEDIFITYFQIVREPRSVKYGKSYTILADNFRNILQDRQRFIPANLPFDDPIGTVEAAKLINVHIQYLQRLARTGRIDAKKSSGVWYVSQQSTIEYRKFSIKQALMFEYGPYLYKLIKMYLSQPYTRLPITEHKREPILKAFDSWLVANEKMILAMKRKGD